MMVWNKTVDLSIEGWGVNQVDCGIYYTFLDSESGTDLLL